MLSFLPIKILKSILNYNLSDMYEIRLRVDKPIYINYKGVFKKIDFIVTSQHINDIFLKVCSYSVYAFSNSIKKGYITTELGVRVGIAGEFVYENNNISSVKNISSLVIRIPHHKENCSKNIQYLFNNDLINLFIVSPPSLGKTTIIRDLASYLSYQEKRVVVIDEKNEIFLQNQNYGNCIDFLKNIKKVDGINFAIKNLNPQIIVLDELSTYNECRGVYSAIFSGVKVIATTHAKNYLEFKNKPLFYQFIKNKCFNYYVILGDKIGDIKEIYDINGKVVR